MDRVYWLKPKRQFEYPASWHIIVFNEKWILSVRKIRKIDQVLEANQYSFPVKMDFISWASTGGEQPVFFENWWSTSRIISQRFWSIHSITFEETTSKTSSVNKGNSQFPSCLLGLGSNTLSLVFAQNFTCHRAPFSSRSGNWNVATFFVPFAPQCWLLFPLHNNKNSWPALLFFWSSRDE